MDLTSKTFKVMEFKDLLDYGWNITKSKLQADFLPAQSEKDCGEDYLDYYGTHKEHESVILMPVPTRANQI